jgi:hypothetical protein
MIKRKQLDIHFDVGTIILLNANFINREISHRLGRNLGFLLDMNPYFSGLDNLLEMMSLELLDD